MISRRCIWCLILVSGTALLVHSLAEQAVAQANRRGYSSRGINPAGGRTSGVRVPTITGARSSYNAGYGARYGGVTRGPLTIPGTNGFYLDLSTPYFYPGDLGQSTLPAEGEMGATSEAAASTTRPNIRPRLDIGQRNALTSNTVLAGLNRSVRELIAACPEKPFTQQWFAAHPDVAPLRPTAEGPWQPPEWSAAKSLLGLPGDPFRYDYRPDDIGLIYVYRNDVSQQRAVDAREPAIELAESGSAVKADAEALSLGVFAAVSPLDEPVKSLLYLAVDRAGTVSGYQYTFADDSMKPVRGAVDPESQRVAWRVGEDYGEAGLKNLTEDVARFLFFKSDGWTQPWILIRMNES